MDRYILIIVGEISHDVAIYTAIIKGDNPKSPHLSSMIRWFSSQVWHQRLPIEYPMIND